MSDIPPPPVQRPTSPNQPPAVQPGRWRRRAGDMFDALGSRAAVRVVLLMMLVYAATSGMLVFGYAEVSRCVANYADASAASNKLRAGAAAEDRALDARLETVNASDIARIRADQAAMLKMFLLLSTPKAQQDRRQVKAAFDGTVRSYVVSAQVLAKNQAERNNIARERAAVQARRAASPVPAGPSITCG